MITRVVVPLFPPFFRIGHPVVVSPSSSFVRTVSQSFNTSRYTGTDWYRMSTSMTAESGTPSSLVTTPRKTNVAAPPGRTGSGESSAETIDTSVVVPFCWHVVHSNGGDFFLSKDFDDDDDTTRKMSRRRRGSRQRGFGRGATTTSFGVIVSLSLSLSLDTSLSCRCAFARETNNV